MSKPLRRPMFRMGGSPNTNSGIVSGFAQPRKKYEEGTNPFDSAAANLAVAEAQDKRTAVLDSMKAQKQSGLSTGDWLRIAAAGGEILGAEGRGSGLKGALAAAGPALSGLGKDLATSSDAREATFQAQDAAYKQAVLSTAQSDVTGTQEYLQGANLLELKDYLEPFKFADEQTAAKATELEEQMSKLSEDSVEYKQLSNQYVNIVYGPTTRANIEAKSELIRDSDFKSQVNAMAAALKTDRDSNPNSPYKNYSDAALLKAARKDLINQVIVKISVPKGLVKEDGNALGGTPNDRTKFANGSTMTTNTGPYEPGSGPNPDPGSPPVMQFEELRARLPQEVSDSVIKLIMQSEQAMVDFAQIQTPQDIQVFNQKYNTDLQTPTQVA